VERSPAGALKRGGERAATGTDVLAVLTVCCLLFALVLPLYVRAKERGREETCYGNLRRLTQAVLMYAQDNDGCLVPASIDWRREVKGKTWFGTVAYWPLLVYPYVGTAEPYWCPSAPFERKPWGPGTEWKTYGINLHLTGRVKPESPTVHRLSDVRRPEETGVFVDSSGVCLLGKEDLIAEPAKEPYLIPAFYAAGYVSGGRSAFPAHNGGMNLAYLDGHVECLPQDRVLGKSGFAEEVWGRPFGP
jgi:prepilin-type processing-associated H-X9-DG protein